MHLRNPLFSASGGGQVPVARYPDNANHLKVWTLQLVLGHVVESKQHLRAAQSISFVFSTTREST